MIFWSSLQCTTWHHVTVPRDRLDNFHQHLIFLLHYSRDCRVTRYPEAHCSAPPDTTWQYPVTDSRTTDKETSTSYYIILYSVFVVWSPLSVSILSSLWTYTLVFLKCVFLIYGLKVDNQKRQYIFGKLYQMFSQTEELTQQFQPVQKLKLIDFNLINSWIIWNKCLHQSSFDL